MKHLRFIPTLVSISASAMVIGVFSTFANAEPSHHHQYRAIELAQDDAPEDDTAIPGDQVDKYIAVYSAMQKDHSLSVDSAASKQGLTVAQFRALEDKIEQNPVIHQRVLDSLKANGDKNSASAKSGSGKSKSPESDRDPMRGKDKF